MSSRSCDDHSEGNKQHKAAEHALHEAAGRTGDFDGVRRLLDVAYEAALEENLVRQVLRRDFTAAMPYFWRALDLAEEAEDCGVRLARAAGFNPLHIARTEKALKEAEAGVARERCGR
jgi:hypothetical protein